MPPTKTALASIEMSHVRDTKATHVFEEQTDGEGRPHNLYVKSALLAGQPCPARILVTIDVVE